MELSCDILNSAKHQTLKQMSDVSEFTLNRSIENSLDLKGDFPQLDEIPGSNSEKCLVKQLNIKNKLDYNYTSVDQILNYTGTKSLEEALPVLNNMHKDLNVDLYPLSDDTVIVEIDHRPTKYRSNDAILDMQEYDMSPAKNRMIIENQLDRMAKLFGVQINTITNMELQQDEWKDIVPESRTANAFIYNNQIYINTDNANINESKVHELMHLFLGATRFTNPDLYFQMVQSVEQLPNYDYLASFYSNRTQADIDEEIFVSEFSKYLTGGPTMFSKIDPKITNSIIYEINRNVDNFIDGKYSAQAYPFKQIANSSIMDLTTILGSDISINKYQDLLDSAQVHRILANTKETLMKKNELIQECS